MIKIAASWGAGVDAGKNMKTSSSAGGQAPRKAGEQGSHPLGVERCLVNVS